MTWHSRRRGDRALRARRDTALTALDRAFDSPADLDPEDPAWETVEAANLLHATVSGGTGGSRITTGAVIDGCATARALLTDPALTTVQRAAVAELLAALEES